MRLPHSRRFRISLGLALGIALAIPFPSGWLVRAEVAPPKNGEVEMAPAHLQAFWIDRNTILIPRERVGPHGTYRLFSDDHAGLQVTAAGVRGGISVPLTPGGPLSERQMQRFPQLRSGYAALNLPNGWTEKQAHRFLIGQLLVSVQTADGSLEYATGVQDAGVLDDLYAYSGPLGAVIHHSDGRQGAQDGAAAEDARGSATIRVWAPTAQQMNLLLFLDPAQSSPSLRVPMHRQGGVWSAVIDGKWVSHYYLFDEAVYAPSVHKVVENLVTDPYSIDLSMNGEKESPVGYRCRCE